MLIYIGSEITISLSFESFLFSVPIFFHVTLR
jgi:hypothetical protein